MSTRRDEGSFKAWLFRIARNHTFDHIRARRPVPASFDDPDFHEEPTNVVSLHQQVERRSDLDWLLAAMGRLPERQREALVLRELGGMSYDEIGATLDTTPEGVKQLIKRGRANVTEAAEASGHRSKKLARDLAMSAPIVTIGWIGAGAGSASAAATGSAVAGGTGLALIGGKTAATILAVVAVGTGSVVVGEKVATEGSSSDATAESVSSKNRSTTVAPTQSLTVGEKAAERAKANKIAANKRRERAQERRAEARAERAAAAERSAAAKAKAKAKSKSDAARANGANGSTRSDDRGNSSGGGSSNSNTGSTKPAVGKNADGTGSGSAGGSGQSTTQGGGNGSTNSNAGGKSKE